MIDTPAWMVASAVVILLTTVFCYYAASVIKREGGEIRPPIRAQLILLTILAIPAVVIIAPYLLRFTMGIATFITDFLT